MMKKLSVLVGMLWAIFPFALMAKDGITLTLIPPTTITNKVDLDIRAGLKNEDAQLKQIELSVYLHAEHADNLLHYSKKLVAPGQAYEIKHVLPTHNLIGKNKIILLVKEGGKTHREIKEIEVIESDIRSTRLIDGAWAGIYHWSETEGKHWNTDIKKMTDEQWKEMVRGMHKLKMDIVVIQEVFRNEEYVGKHQTTVENYQGKAFYPSELYKERVPIVAHDPVEAILSEADELNMHVFVGVGMFAWFDFTSESLEWHKKVAKELWDKYGHHPSFYGFYVSEESGGNLDNWEKTDAMRMQRKKEIVDFFREFKAYCNDIAPAKPVMLATNSMQVPLGVDTYPALLQNLDILCPFGFARMPEGDLTGKESADLLQSLCDAQGAHLWFDLETFLFNEDQSLYPRPMDEIIRDLNLFENFEKILCYQFPGVFNDPKMSIRVGEKRTLDLFRDYQRYLKKVTHMQKRQ
ncbi:DUF4434 domain-containing protein [Sphingobacterium sp. SGR-19]|uniref:DUF4434 domain-containing protein n=1 Tax=Sphingobacterium sp. SGR-19 TaxID=2710886 RepID=UPI0013EB1F53|nr:DUF4434 domain-containing protein [Sphingobacterium sp. SGR-19]NGM65461.1 DUF4434 domain-containing protein [Sphingobacterium sp. SGR-19]